MNKTSTFKLDPIRVKQAVEVFSLALSVYPYVFCSDIYLASVCRWCW